MSTPTKPVGRLGAAIRSEAALPSAVIGTIIFYTVLSELTNHPPNYFVMGLIAGTLVSLILWSAFAVVRHADAVAHVLGEPFGTLVLTLAVTCIEVSIICAVMFSGSPSEGFARDTMFAVVMIVLNGLVGLALLLGGFKHREQTYRLESCQAYLGVIVPLAVFTLILPNFTYSTRDASLSGLQMAFLAIVCVLLFFVFLGIQTVRNRNYFEETEAPDYEPKHVEPPNPYKLGTHCTLLISYLIPIVLLGEKLGHPIDYAIQNLHAPQMLGGALVGAMILAPEGLTALKSAVENRLQRSINILLGSVLASIALTVPAILAISYFAGRHLVLGLNPAYIVLLTLTLFVSTLTFFSGKTNILLGAIHLVLFVAYLILMFD